MVVIMDMGDMVTGMDMVTETVQTIMKRMRGPEFLKGYSGVEHRLS